MATTRSTIDTCPAENNHRHGRTGMVLALLGLSLIVVVIMVGLGALFLGWVSDMGEPDACAAEAIEARAAAEEFYATEGRFPSDPAELVTTGLLEHEPIYVDLGYEGDQAYASPKPGADCAVGTD
ncbi:hypothetical protein PO878_14740 [Iamia majanohamensis]|uniref:Uncharacterized protein n=1 Tax=Iamia majanohamensis TaxID=467976 RepID=A0AAE9Y7J4_9ACTN|nr:hypothetical protein [Iamia majanohamensis]WCO65759.1 hypothetical protein PO878_14740 [Iamia majanohamensis]